MSSKPVPAPVSPFLRSWHRWKALRLPWRRRFLIGLDLHGNTFWEFRDPGAQTQRWRRIVQYPRKTHPGDVAVSPAWHQWLRHLRPHPPSLSEQAGELSRQERLKVLAAQADARWAAKPRLVEPLPAPPIQPALRVTGRKGERQEARQMMMQQPSAASPDPWKQRAREPGERWQPNAWEPSSGQTK